VTDAPAPTSTDVGSDAVVGAPAPPTGDEETREARRSFALALGAVRDVAKTETANTGTYSYSYAPLGAVLEEVKRVCALYGLTLTQHVSTAVREGVPLLAVYTRLLHGDGAVVSFPPICIRMPVDPQPLGSAITYLRRYALLTIFAISTEDDVDGRVDAAPPPPPEIRARTQAEAILREHIQGMDAPEVTAFRRAFKEQFGCTLAQMPKPQHDEALVWAEGFLGVSLAPGADDDGTGYG